MALSKALVCAGIGAVLALPLQAAPALADTSRADTITCAPQRLGRCSSSGECKWRAASERDKQELLRVDFKAKKAFFSRRGTEKLFGVLVEDRRDGGLRRFSIARDEKSKDPKRWMRMTLDNAGMLKGSRAEGRVRFEATCKAS